MALILTLKFKYTITSLKPMINHRLQLLTIGFQSSPRRVRGIHLWKMLTSVISVTIFKTRPCRNGFKSRNIMGMNKKNNSLKSKMNSLGMPYLSSLLKKLLLKASLRARPALDSSVTSSHSSAFSQQRWFNLRSTMERTTMKSPI